MDVPVCIDHMWENFSHCKIKDEIVFSHLIVQDVYCLPFTSMAVNELIV